MCWLRRPEAALFVMVLATYAYFYQAGGWNQNARFDLTRALVEQGSVRIDGYADNTGDRACRGPEGRCRVARPGLDHYYLDKAPGLSWLAVPVWTGVWALRGDADEEGVVALGSYLATLFAVALPSASSVVALWVILGVLGLGPSPRTTLCLAHAFGTGMLPYATLFYGHAVAASLAIVGFALLVRHRGDEAGPTFGVAFAAGLCLGGAVAVEYPAVIAVGPILLYAATRRWREGMRIGIGLTGGVAIPLTLLAAYHATAFGGIFTTGYAFSTQPHRGAGLFMGLGWPQPGALWGLTFSPFRGLFFTAPWLLLALPGWLGWWRRAHAEGAVCIAAAAGFALLNLLLVDWEGGWATGPRYMVPSLPFWTIGAAGSLVWAAAGGERSRRLVGMAFAATGLWSAALFGMATAVGPEVSERIASPWTEHLLPHFRAGELAVSTQSFDMARPAPLGPRRAWNLGQALGLEGLASLLPLAAAWGLCGIWLGRALRGSTGPFMMTPCRRPRSIPSLRR